MALKSPEEIQRDLELLGVTQPQAPAVDPNLLAVQPSQGLPGITPPEQPVPEATDTILPEPGIEVPEAQQQLQEPDPSTILDQSARGQGRAAAALGIEGVQDVAQAERDLGQSQADLTQQQTELAIDQNAERARIEEETAAEAIKIKSASAEERKRIINQPEETFWGSKSTANKIGTAITAFLSGFLAPVQGGRNVFIEQMNRTVDQMARKHRQKIADELGALDADTKGKLEGIDLQKVADLAEANAQLAGRQRLVGQMQASVQGSSSELAAQKAELAIPEILKGNAELERRIEKDEAALAFQKQKHLDSMRARRAKARAAAVPENTEPTRKALANANPTVMDLGNFSVHDPSTPEGLKGLGVDDSAELTKGNRVATLGVGIQLDDGRKVYRFRGGKEDADFLKEADRTRDGMRGVSQSLVDAIGRIEKESGRDLSDLAVEEIKGLAGVSPANRRALDSALKSYTLYYKEAANLGAALNEQEYQLLMGKIFGGDVGSLQTMNMGAIRERVQDSQNMVEDGMRRKIASQFPGVSADRVVFSDVAPISGTKAGRDALEERDVVDLGESVSRLRETSLGEQPPGALDPRNPSEKKKEIADTTKLQTEIIDDMVHFAKVGLGDSDAQEATGGTGGNIDKTLAELKSFRAKASPAGFERTLTPDAEKRLNKAIKELEKLSKKAVLKQAEKKRIEKPSKKVDLSNAGANRPGLGSFR